MKYSISSNLSLPNSGLHGKAPANEKMDLQGALMVYICIAMRNSMVVWLRLLGWNKLKKGPQGPSSVSISIIFYFHSIHFFEIWYGHFIYGKQQKYSNIHYIVVHYGMHDF